MGRKIIIIVLDGFGIGAMEDASIVRPEDVDSNTLGSILGSFPNLSLPTLEQLGLMNAFGRESAMMHFSEEAVYGKIKLKHHGADTFMGHQEIMGTLPKKPLIEPFQVKKEEIKEHLIAHGHHVEERKKDGLSYLLVDHYATVGDNIDADYGMAYNVTAPLDFMPFEKELKIAKLVREVAKVNRVIPFGGTKTTIEDILAAEETREGKYIGIHAVNSKSYENGYQCLHLGYGVNNEVQAPTILTKAGIAVSLFGKVADIVINDGGKSVSCVDTGEVLDLTIKEIQSMDTGFICTNVQETDLAGHSQNAEKYKSLLELADKKIAEMIALLKEEDILIVCADHGNDPCIGHNRHTRENVPLLIKSKKKGVSLGVRETLSDLGASVCDYFHVAAPENGTSFLDKLK